jgi:hypothetical protein
MDKMAKKEKKEKFIVITGDDVFFYWEKLGQFLQNRLIKSVRIATGEVILVVAIVTDAEGSPIINSDMTYEDSCKIIEEWHRREKEKDETIFFAPSQEQFVNLIHAGEPLLAECMIITKRK